MATRVYVVGQVSGKLSEPLAREKIVLDAGSPNLTKQKLSAYDAVFLHNLQFPLAAESMLALMEFSEEGGNIVWSQYFGSRADYLKRSRFGVRTKDGEVSLSRILLNSDVEYFDQGIPLNLKTDGVPINVETFRIENNIAYDEEVIPIGELQLPKNSLTYVLYIEENSPFFGLQRTTLDVGDSARGGLERLVVLDSDIITPVIRRELRISDDYNSHGTYCGYIEGRVLAAVGKPFITEKSYDEIMSRFYDHDNSHHVVAILNEQINPKYASLFGKEINPTGRVFGAVCPLFDGRYAERNLPLILEIFKNFERVGKVEIPQIDTAAQIPVETDAESEKNGDEPQLLRNIWKQPQN